MKLPLRLLKQFMDIITNANTSNMPLRNFVCKNRELIEKEKRDKWETGYPSHTYTQSQKAHAQRRKREIKDCKNEEKLKQQNTPTEVENCATLL